MDHAEDGETANALASDRCYDLIILDLNLPKMDGATILRLLRRRKDQTAVLVLTARGERESVVALLNAGADDYLTKPFDLGELIARTKALTRRGKGMTAPVFELGELQVDTAEQTVSRAGVPIPLSRLEYRILEYMVHRPRAIVSKRELLEHMYDYNWEHHSNVIEAHLSNLRRKLDEQAGKSIIETVRGRGYRLLADRSDIV